MELLPTHHTRASFYYGLLENEKQIIKPAGVTLVDSEDNWLFADYAQTGRRYFAGLNKHEGREYVSGMTWMRIAGKETDGYVSGHPEGRAYADDTETFYFDHEGNRIQ